jgi:nucleoside-diphosphate-sugar epimerase
VYGPGQIGDTQYSSVISSWIHCIENNKPLILEGDGNQSRDFVYIDDIIRANIIVANHNKQFNGIAYNVSTGISTTNNMILKCFEEYFGELDIVKVPPRKGDIDFSLGNSSRIKSHLNFSTKVPFSEGIIKTFNYHSNLKETK